MEGKDKQRETMGEYLESKEGKRDLFLLYSFFFLSLSGILARIMLLLDSMIVKLVKILKGN